MGKLRLNLVRSGAGPQAGRHVGLGAGGVQHLAAAGDVPEALDSGAVLGDADAGGRVGEGGAVLPHQVAAVALGVDAGRGAGHGGGVEEPELEKSYRDRRLQSSLIGRKFHFSPITKHFPEHVELAHGPEPRGVGPAGVRGTAEPHGLKDEVK